MEVLINFNSLLSVIEVYFVKCYCCCISSGLRHLNGHNEFIIQAIITGLKRQFVVRNADVILYISITIVCIYLYTVRYITCNLRY